RAPSLDEAVEHRLDPRAPVEPGVQRLVVLAVAPDELLGPSRVEDAHLLVQAPAAHVREELLVSELPLEHGPRRVPHGRENDRTRVDQGPVEVEEDDRTAHPSILATPSRRLSSRGAGPV